MRWTKRYWLFAFLAMLAAGLIGLAFAGGFAIAHHQVPPHAVLAKVDRRVVQAANAVLGRDPGALPEMFAAEIESVFVRLSARGSRVPVAREGAGGGLASIGDDVLVLTHTGEILAATGPDEVRPTAIGVPDNGFAAYEAFAASGEAPQYTHHTPYLRYNDILHFASADGHGLALSYTEYDAEQRCYATAIAVLPLAPEVGTADAIEADAEDWDVVFRTEPCLPLKETWRALEGHAAGGRIAFAAPETIYLGSGDYHFDGVYSDEHIAQRPDMDYGRVIEINLRTGAARQLSIGQRNIQGIALDGEGTLWTVEHAMRGGDELNRIVAGTNFGWPLETLGTSYAGTPWPLATSYGRHDEFTPPTYAWVPSVAISNLTVANGFHDSWDGDLIMATLAGQSLHRIRVEDERVLFDEPIPIGKRLRYVHQHTDGRLVLWTDDHYLIFLTVAEEGLIAEFIDGHIEAQNYDEGFEGALRTAVASCAECHSFEVGGVRNAPSLAGVFEDDIAGTGFAGYSAALEAEPGAWTRERLAAYLSNPSGAVPGTIMPAPGLQDEPELVQAVVDLLEALSQAAEPAG